MFVMIFFTSDTHFGHANILKYCPNRKFSTVDEHDEHLIRVWNDKVKPDDTIFHLGDFAFGAIEKSYSILDRLHGKKVLITGNHDVRHMKHQEFRDRWRAIFRGYHEVEVQFQGHTALIVLCHFPLESFNKMRYGSFHCHGHTHTPHGQLKMRYIKHRKDIGVDSRLDHAPWGKDELLETMSNEEPIPNVAEV